MKHGFVYLRPLTVAFARATGQYGVSSQEAWNRVFAWLEETHLIKTVGTGYGLLLDDPRNVDPSKCRYDACIELTEEARPLVPADFGIGRLPGGAYARRRHVGGTAGLGDVISDMRKGGIEANGLRVDSRRPLIEIYFDNPRFVGPAKQRIDVCMPVSIDESHGRSAA